jgi:hypothetical protein
MLRIAEMGIHLALQRTLKHDLGQPAQQAARPGQRQAVMGNLSTTIMESPPNR